MAIRDLLWACPACGAEAALRGARWGREVCARCNARLRRVSHARIEVKTPDGQRRTATAAEWLEQLPPIQLDPPRPGHPIRRASVLLQRRTGREPIRRGHEFLNSIDVFAAAEKGTLALHHDRLEFDGPRGPESWPLERLGALGSSSKSLQLRLRDGAVFAVRFPEASVRFWEELLREALRARYAATGRGEIVEFQPRIVTR